MKIKYIGDSESVTVGGVEFVKFKVVTLNDKQAIRLAKLANNPAFEISKAKESKTKKSEEG